MDYSKQKRNLLFGILGCLLFVIGDYLYAAVGSEQSTDTIGFMVRVAYLDIAAWRMAASILCGVLGTALYYVGFHQMGKLLKQRIQKPKHQKWIKSFRIAYITGTVCWGYVHAMFMNIALVFKFTYESYGNIQTAAEIANRVFYYNAIPMAAAFVLCDGLLSIVMIVMVWKRMLPFKSTAQRVLATLCNPLLSAGVIGNLSTLLPWPLNQFDNGSESLGHALVLVLGLILLRNIKKGDKLNSHL